MTTLQQEVISIITAFAARKNAVEATFSGAGFFALTNFKNLIDVSTCHNLEDVCKKLTICY